MIQINPQNKYLLHRPVVKLSCFHHQNMSDQPSIMQTHYYDKCTGSI